METNSTTPANPGAGRGLGIAGMILGIVAIVVSFIPCFGWWAILLAIVGVVLSAISMSQASKAGASKGMAIAGLICSILAIVIVSVWIMAFAKVATKVVEEMDKSGMMDSLKVIEERMKEVTDSIARDISGEPK